MVPAGQDSVSPKLLRDGMPDGSPEPPGLCPLDVDSLPPGEISTVMRRSRGVLQGSPPVSAFAASVTPTMVREGREGAGMYSNADGQAKGKKKSFLRAVWDFLFLVMQTSSIHGFNHLTDDKRHFFERIVWTAFVLLGLYGAVVVSLSTWDHYQENPTVIAMERDYKEWNTSFPSVTICPTIKYDEESVERVADSLTHIQDKERLKLFLMTLANATYTTFSDVIDDFNDQIKPSDYMDLVLAVKLEFSYSVSGSNDEASAQPLQPTITEHGICYAFSSDVAVYFAPEHFKAKNSSLIDRGWSYNGSPLDGKCRAVVMNSGTYPFKICDVKGLHCLDKHKVLMSTLKDPVTNKKVDCKCLPSCVEVNYISENDHTIPWFMGTCLKWGMNKYPRMRLKRDVLFGFIDVLVAVGGTAGLFLGCSVLSIVEIIYFFTLKAFFYVKEHYKDTPEDEDGERPESVDSGQPIVPRMFAAARSFSTVHLHC
ncbi:uncharacterized protein LOC117648482 [Thrips palmi]|uniref:Uncharacterized protein LOC117648482 n=1 Tax=Thrips palmi TaxID=161013 RepID=A0A6P8ZR28_THRPL|nr:uncharacterized protein LOC117648482 [Thrips palmi]